MTTQTGADVTSALDDPRPDLQREVTAMLHDLLEAVRDRDVDRLESLHRYGPKFTKFDDFEPLHRQDAETCRLAEREGIEGLDEADFTLRDLQVDVFGQVSVATFVLEQRMRAGAETVSADARSTLVLVREDGRWRITHEHFSAFKANP